MKIGLIISFLFFSNLSWAQQHQLRFQIPKPQIVLNTTTNKKVQNFLSPTIKLSAINVIPQNLYTQNFGFFCKQELVFEKVTKIPLRFRIGSLVACNIIEQKNNTPLITK
jgi:hypothetical protein